MYELLKKLYDAVSPGTEIMLYMAKVENSAPAMQLLNGEHEAYHAKKAYNAAK